MLALTSRPLASRRLDSSTVAFEQIHYFDHGGSLDAGYPRARLIAQFLLHVFQGDGNCEGIFGVDDKEEDKPWGEPLVNQWVEKDYPRQQVAVDLASPQGKLEWHFMQMLPYQKAKEAGLPAVVARFTPLPLGGL